MLLELVRHLKAQLQEVAELWQFMFSLVGQSEACRNVLEKKTARRIQKNLKNIIWYTSYESSKTGKCYTFLVSFIIPLLWP